MLVRSSNLEAGMSQYLVDQIASTKNIDVVLRSEVVEAIGEERLEKIKVKNLDSEEIEVVPAAAMFIFIGAVPPTDLVSGLVERDRAGFIVTGPDLMIDNKRPKGWRPNRDPLLLETSVPGIFAAGDVRHHSMKRVASAVGEGAVAVALVHQYLKTV
jgi:thioredoxin reductase (NADPH)